MNKWSPTLEDIRQRCFLLSSAGYLYKCFPYGGKLKENPQLGLGAQTVIDLLQVVKSPNNHKVYFDNFFTSYSLLSLLDEKGFYATGKTSKSIFIWDGENRKHMGPRILTRWMNMGWREPEAYGSEDSDKMDELQRIVKVKEDVCHQLMKRMDRVEEMLYSRLLVHSHSELEIPSSLRLTTPFSIN
ncbi:Transposase IS4 [Popillia japonica]|uniref:Transposase IS4 n=1 Tax=Popillia japonica TaxID=7064 RepID=A0AAW1HS80_POPJA